MKREDLQKPSGIIFKLVESTIKLYVETGGSLVSDSQYNARLNVCLGCPKFGLVKPIPKSNLTVHGCEICGCPYSTKPRAKTYFSISKLKIVNAECPHETGNKWEAIDAQF